MFLISQLINYLLTKIGESIMKKILQVTSLVVLCLTISINAQTAFGSATDGTNQFISMPLPAGIPFTNIGSSMADFIAGGDFDNSGNYYGTFFGNINSPQLVSVDISTGAVTIIAPITGLPVNQTANALAFNNASGIWYLGTTDANFSNVSKLYTIDITNGAIALIGDITNCNGLLALAIDCDGNAYGVDAVGSNLVSINLSNAQGTVVGPLGVPPLFAQDADFDPATGTLYWSAYWLTGPFGDTGGLRTIDTSTGASTLAIEWGPFVGFAGFAVQGSCATVPVELESFNATVSESSVSLNWKTATELNNSGFDIERMAEGGEFEIIGFIPGFGTTTESRSYSYQDYVSAKGKYSYRLKQIDFDGQFEYSNIIEVDVNAVSEYVLAQNYPNPFNPSTTIDFVVPTEEFVNLAVYNSLGEEVITLFNDVVAAGKHSVIFNAGNLASGMYIVKMKAGSFVYSKKITLMK